MSATFRAEMKKQLFRTRTYVTLSVVVIIPIVITLAVKYGREQRNEGDRLFELARQSGLLVPAAALLVMSQFLLVVVVSVFAGDSVAGEATWGNLRYLLARPIPRARLLGAKLLVAFVFAFVATLLIVVVGLAAGGLAFGIHPLDLQFFGIEQSVGSILVHLVESMLYVWWSMAFVVAFGLMVSTMTDTASGAIGAAVGLAIVSQILDAITRLGVLRYGLPTHYLNAWRDLIVARPRRRRPPARHDRAGRVRRRLRGHCLLVVSSQGHPQLTCVPVGR